MPLIKSVRRSQVTWGLRNFTVDSGPDIQPLIRQMGGNSRGQRGGSCAECFQALVESLWKLKTNIWFLKSLIIKKKRKKRKQSRMFFFFISGPLFTTYFQSHLMYTLQTWTNLSQKKQSLQNITSDLWKSNKERFHLISWDSFENHSVEALQTWTYLCWREFSTLLKEEKSMVIRNKIEECGLLH